MNTTNLENRIPRPIFIGLAGIVIIAMTVLASAIYAAFGAAVVYGYTWLAGDTPVFEIWSFWAWSAPILLAETIIVAACLALYLDNLSWPTRLAAGALPIVWATLPILSNAASKICGALGLTELYRAFSNFHTNSFWLMLAGLVALTIVTIFPRHSTNNDKKKEDDEGARDHKPSQQTLTSDADPKLPEIFIQ